MDSHIIGRASFYEAIVSMQKRELGVTSIVAFILITVILFLVYRNIRIVLISLISVLVGILCFMGILSGLGKELNILALFYPLLLVIVGTSDVVHIIDSYLREIQQGSKRQDAIETTLKGVGISTLLTSLTTAADFAALLFSKLKFIRDFGINSALGVLIMYVTVIFFTCSLLLMFKLKRARNKANKSDRWDNYLLRVNMYTRKKPRYILAFSLMLLAFLLLGVTCINTNFQFRTSLPKGSRIAEDFDFFQKYYSGFRPLEVAVITKDSSRITDLKIAMEIEKVTRKMRSSQYIRSVQSINVLHKTLNKAYNLNKASFYRLPETEKIFKKQHREARKFAGQALQQYADPSGTKGRITAKVMDAGTDSLLNLYTELSNFFIHMTDTSIVDFRLTGKGLLLDKNAVYVRNSILKGLLFALLLVSTLMVILFRNIKLVIISLIPNLLPLLFAGALLGFLGIPLEATLSIVFAIVFGIAVDDTIHFLAKYKLCIQKGIGKEEALEKTFLETGRPLVITTLLLFFGFLVLLFSVHQPSVTIGVMISSTLLTALVFDLLLIPVLIRKLL